MIYFYFVVFYDLIIYSLFYFVNTFLKYFLFCSL
nr:MAG TPA: hypothetical protein [Caudoviricetes sp.]